MIHGTRRTHANKARSQIKLIPTAGKNYMFTRIKGARINISCVDENGKRDDEMTLFLPSPVMRNFPTQQRTP